MSFIKHLREKSAYEIDAGSTDEDPTFVILILIVFAVVGLLWFIYS